MGIEDCELRIGNREIKPNPNPQTQIPNPQSPIPKQVNNKQFLINLKFYNC